MEQLMFGVNEFQPGLNVTVRRGTKWALKFAQGVREVELADVYGKPLGLTGKIVAVRTCDFLGIPATWLQLEHDSSCMDLNGLLFAMRTAYPDFSVIEDVNVVFFEVDLNKDE